MARACERARYLSAMSKLLALLLLFTGTFATAQEIIVAAAADMNAALPQIVEAYTKETGQAVEISFGSSGNLTNQIRNGAPFDIFFSADEEYPQQLISEGLAAKDSLYRYAVRRLVLWVPNDSPVDLPKLEIKALLDPSVKNISIANPATRPCGRASGPATPRPRPRYGSRSGPCGNGTSTRRVTELDAGRALVGAAAVSSTHGSAIVRRSFLRWVT